MNLSMQLAVVVAAACLCLADGAQDGRLVRSKQQRPTRGFKNVEMMTARGFGKRDRPHTRAEQSYEAPARKKYNPKNSLMVAYDFGKRSGNEEALNEEEEIRVTRGTFRPNSNILIARGYGKRGEGNDKVMDADDFLDILGSAPEKDNNIEAGDEKTVESIPVELFVMEMLNHPEFTRSVVSKFIDTNQDGMLSLEELLRNTA